MKEINKAVDLFNKRKSLVILETARKLDGETDIEKSKISEIANRLQDFVDHSWVNKVPPQYKDKKQSKRRRGGKISPTGEVGQDDAPHGYYQMNPEDYRMEDVEQYDRHYLIDILNTYIIFRKSS